MWNAGSFPSAALKKSPKEKKKQWRGEKNTQDFSWKPTLKASTLLLKSKWPPHAYRRLSVLKYESVERFTFQQQILNSLCLSLRTNIAWQFQRVRLEEVFDFSAFKKKNAQRDCVWAVLRGEWLAGAWEGEELLERGVFSGGCGRCRCHLQQRLELRCWVQPSIISDIDGLADVDCVSWGCHSWRPCSSVTASLGTVRQFCSFGTPLHYAFGSLKSSSGSDTGSPQWAHRKVQSPSFSEPVCLGLEERSVPHRGIPR